MLPVLLQIALTTSATAAPIAEVAPTLRTGDIIFHESKSAQSKPLQVATGSRYTHVGMIVLREGTPWVLEAVQPVRYTRLTSWVDRGVDDHAVVMRMRDELTPEQSLGIVAAGEAFLGRPYDLAFGWDDTKVYCSELVFKAYLNGSQTTLAPLRTHRDYNLDSLLLTQAVQKRYPNGLPAEEPVIAPSDLLAGPLLKRVAIIP